MVIIVRWLIGGLFDGLDVVEYVAGRRVREHGSSGARAGSIVRAFCAQLGCVEERGTRGTRARWIMRESGRCSSSAVVSEMCT
nr:uncharacterized protein LOC112289356 isoform X2 [Physcomitrium patens]|eukprot:XP_024390283.1 uncharacterized protein LOC112289356 isoform X2 [Physcomitrella patens]